MLEVVIVGVVIIVIVAFVVGAATAASIAEAVVVKHVKGVNILYDCWWRSDLALTKEM